MYVLYHLPTVVISRRTDQYSKAHEILTGVSATAAKRPRTALAFPPQAASVPPPAASEPSLERPSRLAHASSAPEGMCLLFCSSFQLSHPSEELSMVRKEHRRQGAGQEKPSREARAQMSESKTERSLLCQQLHDSCSLVPFASI